MPILDIQRRGVEVGRIRAGEKGERGAPRRLQNWRLTSKSKERLEAAALLYGGEVRPWAERPGEFELYTTESALPIIVLPGQIPTTWYELWSGGGCQRRCDGQHELLSDGPCLCGDERGGKNHCSPHTRLSVMLPELPGIGTWLLQSNGWNAAAEWPASVDLLQRASAAGVLLPAKVVLEQRHEVKGGQTRRFAVPVIDIDTSFNQLLAQQGTQVLTTAATPAPALEAAPPPPGGTPIGAGADGERRALTAGVSVAEGLQAVQPRDEVAPRANAAEPIGEVIVDAEVGASPEAPDESEAVSSASAAEAAPAASSGQSTAEPAEAGLAGAAAAASDTVDEEPVTPDGGAAAGSPPSPAGSSSTAEDKKATAAQKKALNTLYGELREVPMDGDGNVIGNPLVTVGGLYAWAAKERNIEVELMIQLLEGRDEAGKLHFPQLRDSLTRGEASKMIDGLEGIRARAAEERARQGAGS